jgi:hypothetical protein
VRLENQCLSLGKWKTYARLEAGREAQEYGSDPAPFPKFPRHKETLRIQVPVMT